MLETLCGILHTCKDNQQGRLNMPNKYERLTNIEQMQSVKVHLLDTDFDVVFYGRGYKIIIPTTDLPTMKKYHTWLFKTQNIWTNIVFCHKLKTTLKFLSNLFVAKKCFSDFEKLYPQVTCLKPSTTERSAPVIQGEVTV